MSIFTETKQNHHKDDETEEFKLNTMRRIIDRERLYTVTIKPTATAYKSKHQLDTWAERYVNRVQGNVLMYSFEKMGTNRVHLHMLLQCPIIYNKAEIAKGFKGFHIHAELIRKNREDESIYSWERYINKEASDSEFYWDKFGNMFTEGEGGDEDISSESSPSPTIIHYQ